LCMYENILKRTQEDIEGVKYWLSELAKGTTRESIEKFFKDVALKDNAKNFPTKLEHLLDEDDKGKRILFVMPRCENDVFNSTSLLKSIKESYPNYNIYYATDLNYYKIISANPHVHKVVPYHQNMESLLALEGCGDNEGLFEIVFLPHIGVQRTFDYQHNGKTNLALDLCTH